MCIFDGNPNGRIMCELSNWNGRVYKISRNDLSEFGSRPDAEYTGVYFLFGKNADNDDTVYVGEAERMMTRLKQHLKDENYWNECIAIHQQGQCVKQSTCKIFRAQILSSGEKRTQSSHYKQQRPDLLIHI